MHAYSPHMPALASLADAPGRAVPCLARLAILATLGLALATAQAVQAKTFLCGAGDVRCLIAAINAANAHGRTNTIRLAAGTYTLRAVDNTTDGSKNGLPVITSTLTITGAGATATRIARDASTPAFRLLQVAATGVVTLHGLTLSGGAAPALPGSGDIGGGILNRGTLTLTESTITANDGGLGGGIFNSGTLTVTQSSVTDNSALAYGGIFNSGALTVTQSTITDNHGDGAGGIANDGGTVTITNSTIAGSVPQLL